MRTLLEEALQLAVQTEKSSCDFYRYAAQKASSERVRALFELLAGEEEEHMAAFLKMYEVGNLGDPQSLKARAPGLENIACQELFAETGAYFNEAKALSMALKEEQSCLDSYAAFVSGLREPTLHAIFERALEDTRRHHTLILEEYSRHMGMVHIADMDTYVRE